MQRSSPPSHPSRPRKGTVSRKVRISGVCISGAWGLRGWREGFGGGALCGLWKDVMGVALSCFSSSLTHSHTPSHTLTHSHTLSHTLTHSHTLSLTLLPPPSPPSQARAAAVAAAAAAAGSGGQEQGCSDEGSSSGPFLDPSESSFAPSVAALMLAAHHPAAVSALKRCVCGIRTGGYGFTGVGVCRVKEGGLRGGALRRRVWD